MGAGAALRGPDLGGALLLELGLSLDDLGAPQAGAKLKTVAAKLPRHDRPQTTPRLALRQLGGTAPPIGLVAALAGPPGLASAGQATHGGGGHTGTAPGACFEPQAQSGWLNSAAHIAGHVRRPAVRPRGIFRLQRPSACKGRCRHRARCAGASASSPEDRKAG